jgi:hypothetical protein
VKKLLSLAAFAAVVGTTALPAAAVTVPGNVTVKWNVSVAATLNLNQNYSAAGAAQVSAPSIVSLAAGMGSGSCTANGAGSEAAGTVNFGNVTPDSGANTIGCQYKNAINAVVTTNSVNWSMTEALSAALPAGYSLCVAPNGFTWGAAGGAALSATQSAAANAVAPAGAACGAGTTGLTTTAATALTETNAFTGASPANVGEDYELLIPPLAANGAKTATVVYSVIAN